MIDWRITRLDFTTRAEHVQLRSEAPLALASWNIRSDFALIVTDARGEQCARFIIECDGAAFHDAAKVVREVWCALDRARVRHPSESAA